MSTLFNESFEEIHKRDLRRFFSELKQQLRPVYALLTEAPLSVFWIVWENEEAEQHLTLREFSARLGEFSDKETFRVYFRAYFFRDEWDTCVPGWEVMDNPFNGEERYEFITPEELTVEVFESEWEHLLAYFCREMIRANTPFRLSREKIGHSKFTPEEVEFLREPVERCNARIIAELREQYDALKAIDCLHELE